MEVTVMEKLIDLISKDGVAIVCGPDRVTVFSADNGVMRILLKTDKEAYPIESAEGKQKLIEQTNSNIICDLAHEYGHFKQYSKESWAQHQKASTAINDKCGTPEDFNLILHNEIDAWNRALETLKTLGFNDWSAFSNSMLAGLSSYADFQKVVSIKC